MDHLPYPKSASLPKLKIPYLCGEVEIYDGLGLRDFPQRKRWITDTPSSQWYTCNATARAQSWLYFGLLEELFGKSFERQTLISNSTTGHQHIGSYRLRALLKEWAQKNSWYHRPLTYLSYSWSFLEDFFALPILKEIAEIPSLRGRLLPRLDERLMESLKVAEEQSEILDSEVPSARLIALSIKTLIWSIRNSLITCVPDHRTKPDFIPRQSRLLRSRMLESGKCPYWTEVYLKRYSVAMVYYIAASRSPPWDVSHWKCSEGQCIAYDVDTQRYTTKHVKDDCPCDSVSPNIQHVAKIIRDGRVPLMVLRVLPTGLFALDVASAKYGLHYTAISHVWSGGLGNPSSNDLPQCQLEKIREGLILAREKARLSLGDDSTLVKLNPDAVEHQKRKHSNEVFWMDTLCIPVNLGKELRQKAITQMDLIFAGADNVLILDPQLQLISHDEASKLQLSVQILCFPWMTRCWTFQEARLARVWVVYLSSGLYDPARGFRHESSLELRVKQVKEIWTDIRELELEAISFCQELLPLADRGLDPEVVEAAELARIWCQLSERSTTKFGDRLIILATLLDLSAGEILSLALKERMRAILRTRNSLPLSLLFLPQPGPVIDNAKCRWIPVYPSRSITTEYGSMAKDQGSSCFQFTLSQIKASGFLLDAKDSQCHLFLITQNSPFTFKAWIRANPCEGVTGNPTLKTACILNWQSSRPQDSRKGLVGARFFVQNISRDASSYTLVYDCPLVYTLIRPTQGAPSSKADEYPEIKVSLMSEAATVSLDCGKTLKYVLKTMSHKLRANFPFSHRHATVVRATFSQSGIKRTRKPRWSPISPVQHPDRIFRRHGLDNMDSLRY